MTPNYENSYKYKSQFEHHKPGERIHTIVDVMDEIENDRSKQDHFRKYIIDFNEYWEQNAPANKEDSDYHSVWGSKIIYPIDKGINDLEIPDAVDHYLFSTALNFFNENHIRLVSEISEAVLMSYLDYQFVGYKKFKSVIKALFGGRNSLNDTAKYENKNLVIDKDAAKTTEIFVKAVSDDGEVSAVESKRAEEIESFSLDDADKIMEEAIDLTSTLQEMAGKRTQTTTQIQNAFYEMQQKLSEQLQNVEKMQNEELALAAALERMREAEARQQEEIIKLIENHFEKMRNKDHEIERRDRTLADREQELSDKEALLAVKDQELADINQQVTTKDKLLTEQELALKNKVQELNDINIKLIDKDEIVSAKEAALNMKELELNNLYKELESLKEEKAAEKRLFGEFIKIKESMQHIMNLFRGDKEPKTAEKIDLAQRITSFDKKEE